MLNKPSETRKDARDRREMYENVQSINRDMRKNLDVVIVDYISLIQPNLKQKES